MAAEDINKWVLSTSLSFVIISILNGFLVPIKEKSQGFHDFLGHFGGIFGIKHHLYGQIWFLGIIFIILTLLFYYTNIGVSLANALKINNDTALAWWSVGSIVFFFIVISVFNLLETLEFKKG